MYVCMFLYVCIYVCTYAQLKIHTLLINTSQVMLLLWMCMVIYSTCSLNPYITLTLFRYVYGCLLSSLTKWHSLTTHVVDKRLIERRACKRFQGLSQSGQYGQGHVNLNCLLYVIFNRKYISTLQWSFWVVVDDDLMQRFSLVISLSLSWWCLGCLRIRFCSCSVTSPAGPHCIIEFWRLPALNLIGYNKPVISQLSNQIRYTIQCWRHLLLHIHLRHVRNNSLLTFLGVVGAEPATECYISDWSKDTSDGISGRGPGP